MDDPRVPGPGELEVLSAELEAQPAVLAGVAGQVIGSLRDTIGHLAGDVRRVAFVGLGSSRDACLPAAWTLRTRGVDATVHMPSEPLGPLPPDALVVAVSASGGTPPVIDAVRSLDGRCPVVAVTRDGAGALGEVADAGVALGCDPERSGIAVWSFLASVAMLAGLAELVTRGATGPVDDATRRAAAALPEVRRRSSAALEDIATAVRSASVVHLVAPLARLGPALQAAQVLREVPRLPAVALAAEDWDHAHAYLTVDEGFVALVSGPTEADEELRRWVLGRGRRMFAVGGAGEADLPGVHVDEPDALVRTLLECPIVESIALRAWAAARP